MLFARMAFVFFVLLASALTARAQYPQQEPHFSSEANAVLDGFDSPRSLASAEPFSDLLDFDLPGEQVYKASKALVPRSTYVPNPSFTNEARQAKFNGTMVLRVVVSEEGKVIHLQVLKGLPSDLNQQALNTVRTWKFQPAMMGGQPVSVLVPIEVSFSLY